MYSEQALRHELERHRMQGRENEVRRIEQMLADLYGSKQQAVRKAAENTSAPAEETETEMPDEAREA